MDDLDRLFHPNLFGDAPYVSGASLVHGAAVQLALFPGGTELSFTLAGDNAPLAEVLQRLALPDQFVHMRVPNNVRFKLTMTKTLERLAGGTEGPIAARFVSRDAGCEWSHLCGSDEASIAVLRMRRVDSPSLADVRRAVTELFPPYDRDATDGLYRALTEQVAPTFDAPTPHLYLG